MTSDEFDFFALIRLSGDGCPNFVDDSQPLTGPETAQEEILTRWETTSAAPSDRDVTEADAVGNELLLRGL